MMSNSPRNLVVEFAKMSGAGNDFIVLDNRFYFFGVEELSQLAKTYCARRTGVGADGLLALEASEELDFRMRYFNADGSVGSMCGNGARCLVSYAAAAGIEGSPLRFETDAGPYEAEMVGEDVRLHVPPYRDFRLLPADEHGPERCYLWTGTEHLVVFTDDVSLAPVESVGPVLRQTNPPAGANVNFAEVDDDGLIVRTWEKGVEGETLACGTGATAAATAARLTGRLAGETIGVRMRGGTLTIGFHADGRVRYLEGPAEQVFRGTLEIPV